jgi:hypothetical protein
MLYAKEGGAMPQVVRPVYPAILEYRCDACEHGMMTPAKLNPLAVPKGADNSKGVLHACRLCQHTVRLAMAYPSIRFQDTPVEARTGGEE